MKKSYRKGGFTFKQFFVGHDRCAMKVGTDGVLLGAWAPVQQAKTALDIGSGSGLIALMLAQRNQQVIIDAVELDSEAAQQAQENFIESQWRERLQVFAQDIVEFCTQRQHDYDLIVSNPPYFEPSVSCSSEQREQARYTATLTHQTLLDSARHCLAPDGLFCLVLPYDVGEKVEAMAHSDNWFTAYRVNIRDKAMMPFHRMLLGLKREPVVAQITTLVLKEADNTIYTEDFQRLIRDFYLKY
ncbi:tRNA(1)(Val) (adenine(37)-N(6))-methyltransferase TrmN [Providencia sp. KP2202517]|uniref:tRNA(1)(Val) (adenine(37)-N(6))-methyltransferase TrmN n=1 Tax=Providencia sp. KP2202517 TaxID=3398193 RepID=UPI003D997ECA